MSKSTEDLIRIVEAGGGLMLDSDTKSKEELIKIASKAGQCDVLLKLRNATAFPVDDLVEIATAGDGSVIFEL